MEKNFTVTECTHLNIKAIVSSGAWDGANGRTVPAGFRFLRISSGINSTDFHKASTIFHYVEFAGRRI